jgi:hypothetical protein
VRGFSEFWVIDHSTTTEEVAGHTGGNSGMGGDILYRWGNPQAYRAGTLQDQQFFRPHDAYWIESGYPGEGNILVLNNGNGRPGGNYTSVEEIIPPVDISGHYTQPNPGEPYEPPEPIWIYTADPPTSLYAPVVSGSQRLPNGNTLVCSGTTGTFLEVTYDQETVWHYVNPVSGPGPMFQGAVIPGYNPLVKQNIVFRAYRYAPDYQAFVGRDLPPGYPIEIYSSPPSVVVKLTPLNEPIVLPSQGGNVEFDAFLANISTSSQDFDGWISIAYEGEEPIAVVQHAFSRFASGSSISYPGTYYPIPAAYSAGNYTFTAYVGSFPDEVWDESGFPFEKAGTDEGSIFQPWSVDNAPNPFDQVVMTEVAVATAFELSGNYPNPFNPVTSIHFSLPEASRVILSVYDISGRLMVELVDGYRYAGSHEVTFDASNFASGVYVYEIDSGNFTTSRKMVLLK